MTMQRETPTGSNAVRELEEALVVRPREPADMGRWRWLVRQRMVGVRDVLATEPGRPDNGALAPRHGVTQRERTALLTRLSALGPKVLEEPDPEPVRDELERLVVDIRHHLQRRNDLAWDDVQLELGGSE